MVSRTRKPITVLGKKITERALLLSALYQAIAWCHEVAERAGYQTTFATEKLLEAQLYRELLARKYPDLDHEVEVRRIRAERKLLLPSHVKQAADRAERRAIQ